jgi:hypothetical protein
MKHHTHRIWLNLASILFIFFSVPAFAMQKCPEEFGEKSPLVDIAGWGIVALGFVVGASLMGYIFIRSRGQKPLLRILSIFGGICGMLISWTGGLSIAAIGFFLTC